MKYYEGKLMILDRENHLAKQKGRRGRDGGAIFSRFSPLL
jgi:hypothetical protein